MHTVDTYLDTEEVATIDGEGRLILSLQKESYEAFGLEGKAAKFASKGQKYSEWTRILCYKLTQSVHILISVKS